MSPIALLSSWKEVSKITQLQYQLSEILPYQDWQELLKNIRLISKNVTCAHLESEILSFLVDLVKHAGNLDGCIVEAGVFKGGGTAKISLAAHILKKKLFVFDSFQGLPENREPHQKSILGHSIDGWFRKGEFCGALEEVRRNVEKYGKLESCDFCQGWFDETMPSFSEKISAVYLDVDLALSTKTCLKYLYPRIVPGGILYSQDGDFPLVIEVFEDDRFWEEELGCSKPAIEGLGKSKMIKIFKK